MAENIEKKGKALDAIVDQIPSSCVVCAKHCFDIRLYLYTSS